MRPALLLAAGLTLAALTSAAAAQDGALTDSPACRRALDALQAQERAAAPDRTALQLARQQAAMSCLGARGAAASAPPPRAAQPSLTTPSPLPRVATPTPTPIPVPVPPAVPRATGPLSVGACDATGCWASDGTRLQRQGGQLIGPGGQACTSSGTLLHCTR